MQLALMSIRAEMIDFSRMKVMSSKFSVSFMFLRFGRETTWWDKSEALPRSVISKHCRLGVTASIMRHSTILYVASNLREVRLRNQGAFGLIL